MTTRSDKCACEDCGGTGRAGFISCIRCSGTGMLPVTEARNRFAYVKETVFGVEPGTPMFQTSPGGYFKSIPVPSNRPAHVVMDRTRAEVGSTYAIEMTRGEVIFIFGGVPVEDHDCDPSKVLLRLDRALTVEARLDD